MKRILIRFFALLAAAVTIASCSNIFSGTDLSDATVLEARTGLNDVRLGVKSITPPAFAGALTAAVDQYLTVTFGERLDQDTLGAIKFWVLSATAASDGGRTQQAALAPTSQTVRYEGDDTVIVYKFDLSAAASVSNPIQMTIDPTVLTADNGTVKLNLDGDNNVGEANEDAYVTERAVAGAGIAAGGAAWNPQALLGIPVLGGFALGSTAITGTFPAAYSIPLPTLSSAITIQKFNRTTTAWDTVTRTTADTYAGGVFTATLPAAIANGETYRILMNEYAIVESTTTNNYARRLTLDNQMTNQVDAGPTDFGADATFNLVAGYAFAVTCDTNSRNVYIDVTLTTIGSEGVDPTTATTANIKVYDTFAGSEGFVTISEISVMQSVPGAAQKNDLLRIKLPPTYKLKAPGHTFDLYIGPGVKDLGNTTATTDDVSLGDWKNTTNWPFQFDIVNGGVAPTI